MISAQVQKVSLPMTDGIYNNVRRPGAGSAGTANAKPSTANVSDDSSLADTGAATKKPKTQGDRIELSNVDKLLAQEPSFDRAKVESIKQAIANGQYPLNPRRIAESFHAIEQMISE